jgi:hypothetical protein
MLSFWFKGKIYCMFYFTIATGSILEFKSMNLETGTKNIPVMV